MDSKELTIVIVTFNSNSILDVCLKSIPENIKIILVENSNNEKFKRHYENKYRNLKCILSGENKGYATANNIGLKEVKTKYALVLNPDTVLHDEAIKNFFKSALSKKDFWLIGPASDQMIEVDFKKSNIVEVNNIKGFAIFFNLSKFNNNFFDENYFLYFEEIDLCKRVKNSNGKIYMDRSIIINHKGASSVDKVNFLELEKNRNWHWMWSSFYYHKKYKGFLIAFSIIFPKLFSAIIKTFFYLLILKKKEKEIYFCRLNGIIHSMFGNKSWYRPSLD